MRFEWDAGKNRSNQKKHAGIDFETASRVFADHSLILRKDHDGEQRREENSNGEEIIRIVSAREADPNERRIYLERALD